MLARIVLGLWLALIPACAFAQSAVLNGFPPGTFQSRAAYQPASGGGALSCSYTPVTTGTQGTAYTGATPSASGGTPAYTFSETGTLPGGLSISSSTGVISGTPTANGSFPTIQVKVTDSTSTVANCGSAFTLVIAAPPSYTGPGDVVASAIGFWGLRAYDAAKAGTAAINLCDDTGANCSDVSTNSSTGALNSPGTHGTNNCATSGTCRIATVYDQSGANNCSSAACNATQATNASRPTLNYSCQNGLPCMVCVGSQALVGPTPTTTAQPLSYAVAASGTATGGSQPIVGNNNETVEVGMSGSGTAGYLLAGSILSSTNTITAGNWGAFVYVINGASSSVDLNGTTTSGSSGSGTSSSAYNLCANFNGGDRHFTGNLEEAGIWGTTALNSTQQSNLTSNIRAWLSF